MRLVVLCYVNFFWWIKYSAAVVELQTRFCNILIVYHQMCVA